MDEDTELLLAGWALPMTEPTYLDIVGDELWINHAYGNYQMVDKEGRGYTNARV